MSRRSATRPEVRVGDWWLSTIAPYWGELVTKTRVNGDWEASFTVAANADGTHWRHPALVYGASVEIYLGPEVVFSGTLEEPDWDSGQMIASGASRDGETALALDAAGESTTVPNTAIDQAIARGAVSWTRVGNFGTTPVGDSDGSLVTLESVLDAWAQENGSGWYVNQSRQLRIGTASESNVVWLVTPGSGVLGSSAEERVDRIFARYKTTGGRLATVSYPATTPTGGIEKPVDLTDRGTLTEAKALDIITSMWSDLHGESGWTNGLNLTRGQITTLGGLPADLSTVRAGQAMRLLGVPDPRGLDQNLDVVIGDTECNWEEDTLQVNPVGMAARDDESVLEQVGNLAVDAMAKASTGSSGAQGGIVKDTTSAIGSGSWTAPTGWTVETQSGVSWSAGAVATIAVAGTYVVSAQATFGTPSSAGRGGARVMVNGVEAARAETRMTGADLWSIPVQTVLTLTAGTTVGLEVNQETGSSLNLLGGIRTWFRLYRIGA